MMPSDEACWNAVVARDRGADAGFVYAVRTTGVFCRPSCGARTPLRRNVTFYRDAAAAVAAGYRACRRCRPEAAAPDALRVTAAVRRIESAETPPSLGELSAAAGLSPHHFHRLFKRATGLTPRQYAAARRAERVRAALPDAERVIDAAFDAGFGSVGRFYADAPTTLGMSARAYRRGGAAEEIRHAIGRSTLGSVLVAASATGVCAILLGDDPAALLRDLAARFPAATLIDADPAFEAVVAQTIALVDGTAGPAPDLPLDVRGTAFQQRVWQALRAIPEGHTATYAQVADAIGAPAAVRAVAGACAANALAVAIPCHRVVRSDGSLSGYRWGVARKRALLARERGDADG